MSQWHVPRFTNMLFLHSSSLLVLILIASIDRSSSSNPVQLPECTKISVVIGEVIQEELDTKRINVATNVRLNLGLHETACLYVQTQERQVRHAIDILTAADSSGENATSIDGSQIVGRNATPSTSLSKSSATPPTTSSFPYNNGSLVYTIQYVGLSQLHPIRQRYEFAIPYLESKCICDCPGGADHCPVGYQYKNCTSSNKSTTTDSVCVTTYFAHQPSSGCISGDESELCCELTVKPYENRAFTAVYIGQPEAVAEFRYQLFTSETDGGVWTRSSDETFRVSLNKHQRLEFADDRLEIRVSGTKPFYQLKDGMYFYESSSDSSTDRIRLKDGVPLNELHEYDLGRLGWFRCRNGRWSVRNAWIRLQDAHKVQVKNCKEQTYTESFNAEYYVSASDLFDSDSSLPILGHEVTEEEPWIREVKVEIDKADRDIDSSSSSKTSALHRLIVDHRDSNPIEIDLTIDSRVRIVKTVYHSSSLSDFSGSIQIDRLSNRFLNLTLIGARGTLVGAVYKTITRNAADLAFSHYVDPSQGDVGVYRTTVALPAQVNASRFVCIHPLNRIKDEVCKWLLFEMMALDDRESPANQLTAQRGECADCNTMSVQNFLSYLNPAQWFDGIKSPAEALAMGVELVFYGAMILIGVAVCRRLACPLVRWAVCSGGGGGSGDSCIPSAQHAKRHPPTVSSVA